jgi:hypothetical protein
MVLHTIELGVNTVLRKIERLKHPNHAGKPLAIRKKPHAIDVVFAVSILLNYWYITLMAI